MPETKVSYFWAKLAFAMLVPFTANIFAANAVYEKFNDAGNMNVFAWIVVSCVALNPALAAGFAYILKPADLEDKSFQEILDINPLDFQELNEQGLRDILAQNEARFDPQTGEEFQGSSVPPEVENAINDRALPSA